MNRILIDTPTYQAILAAHPHIEVELLHTTVPQVAEALRKKIEEREGSWTQQIQKAIGRLESDLASRWRMPEAIKGVIRDFLKDEVLSTIKVYAKAEAEKVAQATVKDAVAAAIKEARRQLTIEENAAQARIDEYAKVAAEKHVVALLRAGKLTVAS
ncbi:hypothetical protein [Methylobacterium sp. WL120]|uniref:hypothetical protein n=1 Tax=Methylobacterium sp. WL120 TaxID=2603887 RepID=UPI0011CB65C4|nr:hypothetical protein [Methylobacterium sp. WL120]TXM69643.1 hypothetical protein FV229_04680 [Methylobacterium sp. WL120]